MKTKTLCITNMRNGTGKSTVAAALAAYLSAAFRDAPVQITIVDDDDAHTLTLQRKEELSTMDGSLQALPYEIVKWDDTDNYFKNLNREAQEWEHSNKGQKLSLIIVDAGHETLKKMRERNIHADLLIVPFFYTPQVVTTTTAFFKSLYDYTPQQTIILPNEVEKSKRVIKRKETLDTINWLWEAFGVVVSPVPYYKAVDTLTTIQDTLTKEQMDVFEHAMTEIIYKLRQIIEN